MRDDVETLEMRRNLPQAAPNPALLGTQRISKSSQQYGRSKASYQGAAGYPDENEADDGEATPLRRARNHYFKVACSGGWPA